MYQSITLYPINMYNYYVSNFKQIFPLNLIKSLLYSRHWVRPYGEHQGKYSLILTFRKYRIERKRRNTGQQSTELGRMNVKESVEVNL